MRQAAREGRVEPAETDDPGLVRVLRGVLPDSFLDLLKRGRPRQVDLVQTERAVQEVRVSVVESRKDDRAFDVVLPRLRSAQPPDLFFTPDPDDSIPLHRNRL